jgi:hypothetical protein
LKNSRRHQCNGRKFEWISQNVERKFWEKVQKWMK